MGFGGSTAGMIVTLRNNAKLLNKNNLFSHLKKIEREKSAYRGTTLSLKELEIQREKTSKEIKRDRVIRGIIGILMLIPVCFVLYAMCYLTLAKMFF